MQIRFVDKIEDFSHFVIGEVMAASVIGWDTETASKTENQDDALDPLRGELRLMQFAVRPDRCYVVDMDKFRDPRLWKFFCDALADPNKVVITQNGKFDLKFFTRFMNQGPLRVESFYDTFIASKITSVERIRVVNKNTKKATWVDRNRHGLGEIALRELGVQLDKELQKSDFRGQVSEEQIKYAAHDALILHRIRDSQITKIDAYGIRKTARLEFDFVPCVADLELNGFYVDPEEWSVRTDKQAIKAEELKDVILEAFEPHVMQVDLFGTPVINIDSPQQLIPALRKFGVPLGDSSDEEALKPFRSEFPLVDTLVNYRELATALKKFGPEYLNFISDVDGRIHADFQQIQAPSGRMSCRRPNLQQVTQDEEYRHPFKAQNGGKIITADYGQIELRIMAMQSRDPHLMRAFLEGIHIHKNTCNLVFGEPFENPDPHKYRLSKNLNFGATYGAGPPRFAIVAGIREEEAKHVLGLFWQTYVVLDAYMRRKGLECAESGVTRTHSGRMVKLLFDYEDRSAFSSAERLGRNFGVQGTGADILKRASYLTRNKGIETGLDIRQVNLVHDEIVTETNDDAEVVMGYVKDAMLEAGQDVLDDIPCIVDVKAGDVWSK